MSRCAKDLMQTKVQTVDPEMPLADLDSAFIRARVTGFPVVADGRLVGVVSRSDVVRKLATEQSYAEYISEYHQDIGGCADPEPLESVATLMSRAVPRLASARVEDVMSHSPVTVAPDASLSEVARVLVDKRIHRVLVTSGDSLVGIISSLDLVEHLANEGSA